MILTHRGFGYLTALGAMTLSGAGGAEQMLPILEEITITAQKRVQSLQDVPLSVGVIDGELLKLTGDFKFEEFASRVPNLSFGANGGAGGREGRNIAIRGISGVRTTAYYIDEIPLPESVDLKLLDINRIEVLRGPQGTLYGASSMGGAIKVVTNKPDANEFTFDTMFSVQSVDEGDMDGHIEGVVNVPISEGRSAFRLGAFYDRQSGVFDRVVTGPEGGENKYRNIDDEKSYGLHLSALFVPTEELSITPKIMYQKTESDGYPWADISPENFQQVRLFNIDEPYDEELISASLSLDYELDWGTVHSATSFVDRESRDAEDMSDFIASPTGFGLLSPLEGRIVTDSTFEKAVQEVRVVSSLQGPIQFTAGLYLAREKSSTNRETFAPGFESAFAETIGIPGAPINGGSDLIYLQNSNVEVDEKALFGEISYDFNEKWSTTLGLRWYESDLENSGYGDGFVVGGYQTVGGKTSEDGVNPKANITYQYDDDVMFYSNAAKGFRLGGTNPPGIDNFCQADLEALGLSSVSDTYGEDDLWSYELGVKSMLANGRMRFNGAAFYTEWDELQQNVQLACGFSFIANVGKAVSQGMEFDLETQVTDALHTTLGVGYVDATITDPGYNPAASKGDRIQEVPEWTYSGSATYNWNLEGGNTLSLRGDYTGATESYTSSDRNDPLRTRKKFNKFDVKLSLQMDDWTVVAYIDNLTNEAINHSDGVSNAAELLGRPRISTNRPRTVGISMRGNIF